LNDSLALKELSRYLEQAMDCATRRYVRAPTARQLHDDLAYPLAHGETLDVSCPPNLCPAE